MSSGRMGSRKFPVLLVLLAAIVGPIPVLEVEAPESSD
jgi:hypothetical protein